MSMITRNGKGNELMGIKGLKMKKQLVNMILRPEYKIESPCCLGWGDEDKMSPQEVIAVAKTFIKSENVEIKTINDVFDLIFGKLGVTGGNEPEYDNDVDEILGLPFIDKDGKKSGTASFNSKASYTVLNKKNVEVIADDFVFLFDCDYNEESRIDADNLIIVGGAVKGKNIRANNLIILAPSIEVRTVKCANGALCTDRLDVSMVTNSGVFMYASPESEDTWDHMDVVPYTGQLIEALRKAGNKIDSPTLESWGNRKAQAPAPAPAQQAAPAAQGQPAHFQIPEESWNYLATRKNALIEPIVKICGGEVASKKEMVSFLRGIATVSLPLAVTINDAILQLKNQPDDDSKEEAPQQEAAPENA